MRTLASEHLPQSVLDSWALKKTIDVEVPLYNERLSGRAPLTNSTKPITKYIERKADERLQSQPSYSLIPHSVFSTVLQSVLPQTLGAEQSNSRRQIQLSHRSKSKREATSPTHAQNLQSDARRYSQEGEDVASGGISASPDIHGAVGLTPP